MSKLPITPLVMPSTLKGQQNGKLPDHLLVKIGIGSARMEITASRAFKAMFAEARKAGFDPRHVGDYRPFEQQLNLFLSRYQPATLTTYGLTSSSHRKIWNQADQYGYKTKYWVKKKNPNGSYPATAATPGNSNHGWGLALDIAQELDGDPAPESISQNFVQWLIHNAARYGISAELQSEPWHWRYIAGDAIPQAVFNFETGAEPPPPLPIVLKYPGTPIQLGTRNDAAKIVQHVIGAKVDGWFGPQSVEALRDWQRSRGLPANGVCDEPVWNTMFP
jgi:peptidoglycan hydrolase-like protein with peptidoglycan-binding domain